MNGARDKGRIAVVVEALGCLEGSGWVEMSRMRRRLHDRLKRWRQEVIDYVTMVGFYVIGGGSGKCKLTYFG